MCRWPVPTRSARLFGAFVALLLTWTLAGPGTQARADDPALSGTVTNGTDPIADVFIALTGDAATATTTSDSSGAYSVAKLDDGAYTVSASAPGYEVSRSTVTIVRCGPRNGPNLWPSREDSGP